MDNYLAHLNIARLLGAAFEIQQICRLQDDCGGCPFETKQAVATHCIFGDLRANGLPVEWRLSDYIEV